MDVPTNGPLRGGPPMRNIRWFTKLRNLSIFDIPLSARRCNIDRKSTVATGASITTGSSSAAPSSSSTITTTGEALQNNVKWTAASIKTATGIKNLAICWLSINFLAFFMNKTIKNITRSEWSGKLFKLKNMNRSNIHKWCVYFLHSPRVTSSSHMTIFFQAIQCCWGRGMRGLKIYSQ